MTTILADRKKCTIYADTLSVCGYVKSTGWDKTFSGLGYVAGFGGDLGKRKTLESEFEIYDSDPCRKIPWSNHDHLADLMPILEGIPEKIGDESQLIVVTVDHRLFVITDRGLHDSPLDHEAIGTGALWALSAVQLGRSGKKALEHAIKNDVYTGGDIAVVTAKKEQ